MPYKFEYEYEDKIVNLSKENHDFLVDKIAKNRDKWDELRRPNLEANQAIEKVIYPSKNTNIQNDIKMPEIYEIRETYKAHLWKSWYSSLDTMFDVQGKARDDHFNADRQKAALVDVFREINLISKLEKGLDNWINKGEFIAFVNWQTKVKKVRRKKEFKQNENNAVKKEFALKDEIAYDGPSLTIVSPEAFVFDPDKKENFEACPKIYRSFATFDEIQSNKLYQNFEELKDITEEKKETSEENKATKGDQIEILEYWGDIKLKNGQTLKNYAVTLAGRKKIIRFEQNPFIINPFVFAAFLEDPETKRGISPLLVAMPLNQISSTILNLQLDALKLIINKPYLAPKGSMPGNIKIREGAIIEYDPVLMPKEPIPLEFKDALVGWDFLKFFESKIESATGIFKYMIGSPKGDSQRTATEASGIMLGQNVRLSKEIDILNFSVKVPIIEKVAELLANFSYDIKEIKTRKQNGEIDFILIDESVRQGNYDYNIGDGSAIFERKSRMTESLEILYKFAQVPELAPRIKWIEVLKWAFEQLGSVDPNMFIKEEMPSVESFSQYSPEINRQQS
jgi:hypothetical protein